MFIHQKWYKLYNVSCVAAGVALLLSIYSEESQATQNSSIETIQKEIQESKEKINQNKKDLRELQSQQKQMENEIKEINNKLSKSQKELVESRHRLAKLRTEQEKLNNEKEQQIQMLSNQLVEAYKLGSSDYVKLIFNQEDPNTIGRALEYHIYVNRARTEKIENIHRTIAAIKQNQGAIEYENQKISSNIENQKTEKLLLSQKKKEKEQKSEEIKKETKKEEKKLGRLQARLNQEIEKNQRLLAEEKHRKEQERIKIAKAEAEKHGESTNEAAKKALEQIEKERLPGLKSQKGKLAWPVTGKTVKKFGDSRAGELKWSGLLLQSPNHRKTEVVAIADGDIVMASALEGYGLIVVVDHGAGYLSVYGNNRDVAIKVGERVKKGELLGYYDQNNKSLESSLYFEIRYKGSPINPQKWLTKK